jgi:beta-lactamase class A
LAAAVLELVLLGGPASAQPLSQSKVQAELQRLAARTDGVLAACIAAGGPMACINGERPMPMQSVMKLIVAIAALDAVDRGVWSLDDQFTLHREDITPFAAPIGREIGDHGYRTTLADLITRAVIDSDSTAADFLIAKLGGPVAVQDVLRRKAVAGVRFDRDERHLQTEILGLTWRAQFADPGAMRAAEAAVPPAVKEAAFKAYQADPRDTATARGMTSLLQRLADGQLLSRRSTSFALATMQRTRTFPDRLKAGAPSGWRVAHKTGTSGAWRGVTAATNDVGVLTSPSGRRIVVAAFLANSTAPAKARGLALAEVARIAVASAEGQP